MPTAVSSAAGTASQVSGVSGFEAVVQVSLPDEVPARGLGGGSNSSGEGVSRYPL